jgi:hypothetical protein
VIGTNAAVPAEADALPAGVLATGLAVAVGALELLGLLGLLLQPASATIPAAPTAAHQANCFMT